VLQVLEKESGHLYII